jgi:kynurenine formamidase
MGMTRFSSKWILSHSTWYKNPRSGQHSFFGPAAVIDVREEAAKDPDYRLTVMRIQKWEAEHGQIPKARSRCCARDGVRVFPMWCATYGVSKDFEVHRAGLPAGLYDLENLANTESLPEWGAYLVAAPIKLAGGSGNPVRVFAVLPPKRTQK